MLKELTNEEVALAKKTAASAKMKALLIAADSKLPSLDGLSKLQQLTINAKTIDDDLHNLLDIMNKSEGPYVAVFCGDDVLPDLVSVLSTGRYPFGVANSDENVTSPVWRDLMKRAQVIELTKVADDLTKMTTDAALIDRAGSITAKEVAHSKITAFEPPADNEVEV